MNLSLRAKSALALLLCVTLVLVVALGAGWWALRGVEESLGTGFARNITQYNKQRILAPVLRELALSQRLADSELSRRFLLDEEDAAKKRLFFDEAEGYRRSFDNHSYFLISGISRHYYFNDTKSPHSEKPRYNLEKGDPDNAWFFATMKGKEPFNVNVNVDPKLAVTKVWFNVVVKDKDRNIGLAGTGLDLSVFLKRLVANGEAGVTPMIVDGKGAIQVHPNQKLITFSSLTKGASSSTIFRLLDNKGKIAARAALEKSRQNAAEIPLFWAEMDGKRQLFAVAFLPELNWHAVTAVDLSAAHVLDNRLLLPIVAGGSTLLAVLVLAVIIGVNRILLSPLLKLTQSARAMAEGNYETELPPASGDELGQLTSAFGAMATQVRSHTEELENKVHARTSELVAANKQVHDSIQYASLIQNAILPKRELASARQLEHFALWLPRDVVGGDFYIYQADENGALLGVVDCAGHGVPGAIMTMVAHASLNVAMENLPLCDPAAILHEMDARVRLSLQNDALHAHVATHMDAGLAYVDFQKQTVVFAGAKVGLYWCKSNQIGQLKGFKNTIAGKQAGGFNNQSTPFSDEYVFYLTTDGLLDQAGGEKGFSFGSARFEAMLLRHAGKSMSEQQAAFAQEIAGYQGNLPQRDDITLLGFRFEKTKLT